MFHKQVIFQTPLSPDEVAAALNDNIDHGRGLRAPGFVELLKKGCLGIDQQPYRGYANNQTFKLRPEDRHRGRSTKVHRIEGRIVAGEQGSRITVTFFMGAGESKFIYVMAGLAIVGLCMPLGRFSCPLIWLGGIFTLMAYIQFSDSVSGHKRQLGEMLKLTPA